MNVKSYVVFISLFQFQLISMKFKNIVWELTKTVKGIFSLSGFSRRTSFGQNCSDQCIQYGHSDNCWMPKNYGKNNKNHAIHFASFGEQSRDYFIHVPYVLELKKFKNNCIGGRVSVCVCERADKHSGTSKEARFLTVSLLCSKILTALSETYQVLH